MSASLMIPTLKLNDGHSIPSLGLGTANTNNLKEGEYRKIFKEAVSVGYRHFDTAWVYANQKEIGAGLREILVEGNLQRDDFFITTKVWNTFHKKENVLANCQTSLSELQLNYVDLLLMHFPMGWKECGTDFMLKDENGKCINSDVDYLETWQGLEECHKNGWAHSIGVSNFNKDQLKRLLENCKIKPTVNQVETHPYLVHQELIDFCKQNDIIIEAFGPIGAPYDKPLLGLKLDPNHVKLLDNPVIAGIAKKHGKSNAQILLRWGIQRGTVVIPKTVTKSRMIENLEVVSFQLDDNEMKEITQLNCNWRAYPMD
uniref:NADP-dependent oxidoreductase domain-containing protein n=1 Tax=Strigamia maritima TaxID=126957 RepID=T1IHA7_STRMM